MIHMIIYDLKLFIRSVKGILPLATTLIFMAFTYYPGVKTSMPTAIITSYFYMFYVMLYIGYVLGSNELDIPEHCIYIRCDNKILYYFYKAVCIMLLSIAVSFILVSAAGVLSSEEKSICTVIYGWLLMISSGFCGGAFGQMFHPALIRDRKLALVLVLIAGMLCACRTDVINVFPVLKYIFYVLPPIDSVQSFNTINAVKDGWIIIKEICIFIGYGIIYEVLKSYIWSVRRYI